VGKLCYWIRLWRDFWIGCGNGKRTKLGRTNIGDLSGWTSRNINRLRLCLYSAVHAEIWLVTSPLAMLMNMQIYYQRHARTFYSISSCFGRSIRVKWQDAGAAQNAPRPLLRGNWEKRKGEGEEEKRREKHLIISAKFTPINGLYFDCHANY